MPQNIAEFSWSADPHGYRWKDGVRLVDRPRPPGGHEWDSMIAGGPVLALEEAGPSQDNPHRWYTPESGLYRSFAELDGSPEAVLAFANQYGMLGGNGDRVHDPKGAWFAYEVASEAWSKQRWDAEGNAREGLDLPQPDLPKADLEIDQEETLDGWQMEICAMRMCVDLYDMLASPSARLRLQPHFSGFHRALLDDREIVFDYDTEPDTSKRATAPWRSEVRLSDEHHGDPADPDDPGFYYYYRFYLYRLGQPIGLYEIRGLYIHERDETVVDFATVMLMAILNAHLRSRVETTLLRDPRDGRPVLFTMPNSLIGELWLQLARTIDSDKRFRQCRECRRWFELSPDKARTDKEYCSQACRSRAYRARMRSSRQAASL